MDQLIVSIFLLKVSKSYSKREKENIFWNISWYTIIYLKWNWAYDFKLSPYHQMTVYLYKYVITHNEYDS